MSRIGNLIRAMPVQHTMFSQLFTTTAWGWNWKIQLTVLAKGSYRAKFLTDNTEIPRSDSASLKFKSGADFAEWLPTAWEEIANGVLTKADGIEISGALALVNPALASEFQAVVEPTWRE